MSRSSRKNHRSRGRRTHGATPAHWLNLGLSILVLILLILGIQTLGNGTAGCFMHLTAPHTADVPDVVEMPIESVNTAN